MMKSDSIAKIASALAKFQAEVSNPKNTSSNPMFGSKYAPLDVVINTVKPVLAKFGLSFIQSTGSQDEKIVIKTLLLHESGEWIESEPLVLPAYQLKKGGVKEFNAQGAGSAISYGRRYSLSALIGIASEDDDDANYQSQNQGNQNNQVKQYEDYIKKICLSNYERLFDSQDGFEEFIKKHEKNGHTVSQINDGILLKIAQKMKKEKEGVSK